jgi:CDP-4-dehydro-6-deoxyglucose reductase, E3
MPQITLDGQAYRLTDNESVLDGLTRYGVEIPHGCKSGACQACIMHAQDGELPAQAQAGLSSAQKELGFFLSCRCTPSNDLCVSLNRSNSNKIATQILAIDLLTPQVTRIRLTRSFDFRAGQYVNIWLDASTVRSYSIASCPSTEDFIELHIQHIPNGRFSEHIARQLNVGDELVLQGPMGECFYTGTDKHQPLLLIGIGTGLAPLYGIIKDALHQGHCGPIHLVLGARLRTGFYLQDALIRLTQNPNVQVDFVCLEESDAGQATDIYSFIRQRYASTKHQRLYLCGAESFVRKMKKQVFLAGANLRDIHADAILPCS